MKLKDKKEENYLLNCLVELSKLYNNPSQIDTIIDGLVVDKDKNLFDFFTIKNRGLESLFFEASKKAGFSSKMIKESKIKKDLPKLLLPAIAILKDDKAVILLDFSEDYNYTKIILPKNSKNEPYWVETKLLEEEFEGSLFLLKPNFEIGNINENSLKDKKHWFWGSLSYSKGIYFDVVLASFLLNIFMLATPIFTMSVYDRVVPNSAFDTLWVFSLAILIVYVFDMLIKFTRIYILEIASKKSDVIISSKLFEYVLNIKLSHRFKSVGSFASNLREFDHIRTFITSTSIATLIDLPFIFIFLLVIYIIGNDIVVVPIIASIIIILYSLIIKTPLKKSIDKTSKSLAFKNSVLIESLNTIETIKSFGLNSKMQWKWEEAIGEIAKREITTKLLSNSITTFSNFIIQISNVVIIILGVYAISRQNLTMGGLIALVMLTSRTLAPLNQFASLIANYEYAKSSYKMLNNIMNLPIDYPEDKKFIKRERLEGVIEFKNVKFKYPNSNFYILDDVSFKIKAKESVGIIGVNGSGKTTFLKLILGIYEIESGSILIDNINIKQISPYDLRKNISYIPQEIVLFSGSVKENIINSIHRVEDEEIIKASKMSGVDNFISKNQNGYNMEIKERGEGVSNGQKQSIGVARAFIKKDSSIFLADEPTNALDSITEKRVEENIKTFAKDKTTIIVSHKQSLIEITDRLIVLNNAKIILDGEYEDIIKRLNSVTR